MSLPMRNLINRYSQSLHSKILPYEVIDDTDAYYVIFISLPTDPTEISCRISADENKIEVFQKRHFGGKDDLPPSILHFPADANLNEIKIQSRGPTHLLSIPKVFNSSVVKKALAEHLWRAV